MWVQVIYLGGDTRSNSVGGQEESDAGKEGDRGYADEPLTTIGNRDQSPWRLLGCIWLWEMYQTCFTGGMRKLKDLTDNCHQTLDCRCSADAIGIY